MEVDGDDLDNLFEEHENEGRENDTENGEPAAESAGVRVAPPKRIVKNPRLKFNPERLCGERGIPVVIDHFQDVKFKGKGHEKEDLDKLLATLEHWTHRLFPSMKFEDCLHQIEKLGKKRPVQTCLRKIRLDMPILNSDFVKDDEEDNVLRNDDPDPEPPVEDAFDRLIGQSQNILNQDVSNGDNTETNFAYTPPVANHSTGHILGSSFGSSLTEEQKERMQRNRLLAAERRKAKLAAVHTNMSDSQSADINAGSSENASSAFDSLFKPSHSVSTSDKGGTSGMETDNDANKESSLLDVSNQNSENLGLDDLIDLVDEEEPVCDNISVEGNNVSNNSNKSNIEENAAAFEETVKVGISKSCLSMDTSNGILGENIVKNNYSKANGISFDDTVPINISNSPTDLNINTSDVITQKSVTNNDFNKEKSISSEDTVPINISSLDMNASKEDLEKVTVESNKTAEVARDELLGLESMMDFIDEEEPEDLQK